MIFMFLYMSNERNTLKWKFFSSMNSLNDCVTNVPMRGFDISPVIVQLNETF